MTEILLGYWKAQAYYSIVEGSVISKQLKAHNFLNTTLKDSTADEAFVKLVSNQSQVLHVENASAVLDELKEEGIIGEDYNYTGTSVNYYLRSYSRLAGIYNRRFSVEGKYLNVSNPIKILFGPAGDPLPIGIYTNASAAQSNLTQYVASVIEADIKSANGYINIIDKVVAVPFNASGVLLLSNQTYFLQLLNDTGLLQEFDNTANSTLLAPTDQAMMVAFEWLVQNQTKSPAAAVSKVNMSYSPLLSSLAVNVSKEEVQSFLRGHLIKGRLFSTIIEPDTNYTSTRGNNNVTFVKQSVMNYTVNHNAKLVKTNILTRTGVLHFIDKVIIPANYSKEGKAQPSPVGPVAKPAGSVSNNYTGAICPPSNISDADPSKYNCPQGNKVCFVKGLETLLTCSPAAGNNNTDEGEGCENGRLQQSQLTPRCYNISTHDCINGMYLCLKGNNLCGAACYDPSQYRCVVAFNLCPSQAPKRCGLQCYSAANYTCNDGQLMSKGRQK
jgi:uncharacterized surface protein with fasciclin (FAS1) repeats